MSKRSRIPDPPVPSKMRHYSRDVSEDTEKALNAIISDTVKTAKHTIKRFKAESYLIDGDYGKRRAAAVRNTFETIIGQYSLTEKTSGLFPTAELWANLNLLSPSTIEGIDEDASIVLAAALWLLDNADDRFDLEKLLGEVPYTEDWMLPPFYDLNHTDDVIQAVVYILKHRHAGDRPILDENTEPGETGNAFLQLIDLVDPTSLRHAVATARSMFWKSLDCFFKAEYAIAEKFMETVATYNSAIDAYNAQVEPLCDAIRNFIKWKNAPKEKKITAVMPKPGSPATAGSPLLSKPANPFQDFLSMPAMPFGGRPFLPREDDPFERMERQASLLESLGDKAEKLEDAVHTARLDLIRFIFDYTHCGFTFAEDYLEHYENINLPIPAFIIDDPYEICMGILLLCSPAAMGKLYEDVRGASVEKDLDLPWLVGAMCGMVRDVASHLPWGICEYDEDDLEFEAPPKPLAHPEWYKLAYRDGDDYQRSLAHILYETTGAILPRDMNEFDNAHRMLWKYGVRGKTEVQMAELMTLMYDTQYRTSLLTAPSVSDTEPAEDVDELKEQLKALREQLKKATDEAHEQDRRARKAEQMLQQEKAQIKADRQELAALREIVFTQENVDASDDSVSVALPHEVTKRLVVYGGHETWRKAMNEYLSGDIRYMDKDQAIIDRTVIRNADVVWIQSNAISHRQYYAIIDEVRKIGVPVRYFLYASARKCAEQVVLDET